MSDRRSRFLLWLPNISGSSWLNFGVARSKVKVIKKKSKAHFCPEIFCPEQTDMEKCNWCHSEPNPGAIRLSSLAVHKSPARWRQNLLFSYLTCLLACWLWNLTGRQSSGTGRIDPILGSIWIQLVQNSLDNVLKKGTLWSISRANKGNWKQWESRLHGVTTNHANRWRRHHLCSWSIVFTFRAGSKTGQMIHEQTVTVFVS